jgi:hypothetical protein
VSLPAPRPDATVIVTGASSGIGEALARELAVRGHHVTLVARREDRLHALAGELRAAHGIRATVVPGDLAQPGARTALVRELRGAGRAIAGLCNNAGTGGVGATAELGLDQLARLVEVNANAVHDLTVALLPDLVARGEGAILNVASILGHGPIPRNASYSASKAFVLTFSEALHAELAGTGVSCTAISPGPVHTEIFARAAGDGSRAAALTPGFLWLEPEDVARAGVDGMQRGERLVIPGLANQLFVTAARFVPRGALPLAEGVARRLGL